MKLERAEKPRGDWGGSNFARISRLRLPSPRGFPKASPVPGSFLVPRSVDGKGVAGLFVLCSKVDFPRKFGTLHNIDLLQLPQTPSKFNLANKKDQVSFSSDRDNVNASQYCTENKQALPQTPH